MIDLQNYQEIQNYHDFKQFNRWLVSCQYSKSNNEERIIGLFKNGNFQQTFVKGSPINYTIDYLTPKGELSKSKIHIFPFFGPELFAPIQSDKMQFIETDFNNKKGLQCHLSNFKIKKASPEEAYYFLANIVPDTLIIDPVKIYTMKSLKNKVQGYFKKEIKVSPSERVIQNLIKDLAEKYSPPWLFLCGKQVKESPIYHLPIEIVLYISQIAYFLRGNFTS